MVYSSNPKTPGDTSYIVRLYRSSSNSHDSLPGQKNFSLVGVVERIDNGQRASFRNIEELWRILAGDVPFTDHGITPVQHTGD
jgi:hypothetical protein